MAPHGGKRRIRAIEKLQPPEQQRDVKQEEHGENRCQQFVKPCSPNDRSCDRREGEDQVKFPVQSTGQLSGQNDFFRSAQDDT